MTDIPTGFVRTEVPARLADLGLTFARPAEWVLVDLPAEATDFDAPAAFAVLAVAMAPFAAIVFSVGARPAYSDGTVSDWLEWLARDQGYDPGPVEAESFFQHPAVGCWAMQQSDGGLLRMRLVLFEDGGRLVQVSVMAPQALWSSVHDTLRTMLATFSLTASRGGTAALAPSGIDLPATSFEATGVEVARTVPKPAAEPACSTATEVVEEFDHAATEPEIESSEPAAAGDDLPIVSVDTGAPESYARVARAADAGTLHADHALNQRLLQAGAGFSAPIVTDHGAACAAATVTAAALRAVLTVPYGWHVLDDTRRTLVHDGDGGVQIALSRRERAGRSEHEFLLEFWRQVRVDAPAVEAQRVRFSTTEALLMRNLPVHDELLAQSVLLRRAPEDQFLVVRVTSAVHEHERALNTAELLLIHAEFLDEPIEGPDWWGEAVLLARLGRLEDAELRIRSAVDHLGAYSQIAHLHELRGDRLRVRGDLDGARAAYERSAEWMDAMAAGATSGGEGAALSRERDAHRERLGLPRFSE
ncbi:MAG: hypothetical protein AB7I19_08670 [Planctomycetota bacterium]